MLDEIVRQEPSWVTNRAVKCADCIRHRVGDICLKCKEKHPDRDCYVSIGIRKPESYCPVGEWGKELSVNNQA